MMMPVPLRGVGRLHKDRSPDELHVAVLTGRCKRIKKLLRKGVHIESVNCHGQTPLFVASWGGDTEVVELLLSLCANPNRRCGSSSATPVHAAAYRGSRRVLRLLVEAGADLSLKDKDNLTPRDYADKQPSPIRRHKILVFLDLLLAMTLHRGRGIETLPISGRCIDTLPLSGRGMDPGTAVTPANTLNRKQPAPGFAASNRDAAARLLDSRTSLNRSTINLSKKSIGSVSSVWTACVGAGDLPRDRAATLRRDNNDGHQVKQTPSVANLHKSVSCHLVDQLCVTTSLPLLSPSDLIRPTTPGTAYTCGGPTVYSPYTWLGTPVTVRRPTPALSYSRSQKASPSGGKPDQHAVISLLEELAILRRLRHPAFLEVMAACHVTNPSPDHVTLVFQHVPYGSLYHHLHVMHRDLSVGGAVELMVGIVEGLLFLHAHGWLHSGLSSHALHLVSMNHAKLGSFQHAIQQQTKSGCSMKAEDLGRATWLVPWQAPEVIAEAMVSIKSEVYALAAIIWEIWSGMPPWSGIPEDDIKRRMEGGEVLPYLTGTPPSLVMYLTQYGLKWNAHERDLDLHEIHTMLRSLRVQVDGDERVPAVTAWGPPSVPNTPVVGRSSQQQSTTRTSPHSSNSESNLTENYPSTSARSSSEIQPSQYLQFVTIDQLSSSSSCSSVHLPLTRPSPGYLHHQQNTTHTLPARKEGILLGNTRDTNNTPGGRFVPVIDNRRIVSSCGNNDNSNNNNSPAMRFVPSVVIPQNTSNSSKNTINAAYLQQSAAAVEVHSPDDIDAALRQTEIIMKCKDDGSKHSIRTPSPTSDDMYSAKTTPAIATSTPARSSSSRRSELPPDLLPSKYVPHNFLQPSAPDVLTRSKQHTGLQPAASSPKAEEIITSTIAFRPGIYKIAASATDKTNPSSDSDVDPTQDFTYISNSAKRAFFTDSESNSSKSPSPTNERSATRIIRKHRASLESGRQTQEGINNDRRREVVRETVTVKHERHCFDAQDSKGLIRSDVIRRGLSLSNLLNISAGSVVTRTISHVSLVSADSSATSSGGEGRRPQRTISQVTLTFKKLSTANSSSSSSRDELEQASKTETEETAKNSSRYRRSKSLPKSPQHSKSPRQWEEVTGIKPASHQLTRHSSSCSLSSGGPPSPVHQFVGGPTQSSSVGVRNKHGSLPTSPQHSALSCLTRGSSSIYSGSSSFGSTASMGEGSAIRVNPRRHSAEVSKQRQRRNRRKLDIEPEDDEFIDDEFNADLYDQPHMQLSVGSSENLLVDTRLSATSMMADDSGVYQHQFPGFAISPSTGGGSGQHHVGDSSLCARDVSCSRLQYSAPRHTLNALPENSDEDLSLTITKDISQSVEETIDTKPKLETKTKPEASAGGVGLRKSLANEDASQHSDSSSSAVFGLSDITYSDTDSNVFSNSPGMSDFRKEYEPLKSVQLLRNMGKSLSLYLPKHSIDSDSEGETL